MKKTYKKIAVIGGGIMGTVLIRALVDINSSLQIIVCEKNTSHHKKLGDINSRIKVTDSSTDCADADIIFLAVKPQDFNNIELKIKKETLVCSIMAGVSITSIKTKLKIDKVIRMMPNIAARVRESFTAWTATAKVNDSEKKWVKNFLIKMGDELYVNTEKKIDQATAVTGSGPAYIFNILFIFMNVTQQLGFTKKEAHRMARQVLRGVNALVDKNTNFAELTQQVTSKGGTTEVALKVFADSNLKKIWMKAIAAAYKRAHELSKQK
ncbi:pyrroline-5-carboxylate reductase [Candidatus Nomurabacteria bacterium RIFCSPLOWO2_01_FULL_40_15]|uniref:Pyrroline-5-carboxylate reductase n=1 Tax=Candidatus Nomurabacteria bacterium RIFCSPLOWO2_01_FULL_40_15 TaxID=1801772 RepID=A0A1F6X996_9BACT|nr:MAG: pyrroline-5-carboxylate reductase [Candidatus Nomurabacteria bacterium RIFCSPLOWO2_01_FULL_40_15]